MPYVQSWTINEIQLSHSSSCNQVPDSMNVGTHPKYIQELIPTSFMVWRGSPTNIHFSNYHHLSYKTHDRRAQSNNYSGADAPPSVASVSVSTSSSLSSSTTMGSLFTFEREGIWKNSA